MQTKSYPPAIRPECFLSYGAGWFCPTPEEIRVLIQVIGLTGSQVARLTGVKDSRQVRRWLGGDAQISFAAWAILVESAGFGKIWSV
jgi:hypothetical protein